MIDVRHKMIDESIDVRRFTTTKKIEKKYYSAFAYR